MGKPTISDQEILAQIPAARRRAQRALRTEPHAARVRYDRALRTIELTLTNGVTLVVPIQLVEALRQATDRDLAEVAVGAAGGSARTAAKVRAARLNGRKGGRPRMG